jgi:hypothetical protein
MVGGDVGLEGVILCQHYSNISLDVHLYRIEHQTETRNSMKKRCMDIFHFPLKWESIILREIPRYTFVSVAYITKLTRKRNNTRLLRMPRVSIVRRRMILLVTNFVSFSSSVQQEGKWRIESLPDCLVVLYCHHRQTI